VTNSENPYTNWNCFLVTTKCEIAFNSNQLLNEKMKTQKRWRGGEGDFYAPPLLNIFKYCLSSNGLDSN
jgi:hypothetical protein